MKISPARTSAYDVLLKIENEQAFSSILLPAYESELSAADRGLCHQLVLGTLREQLLLDNVIDQLSKGRKLDTEVRIALRLGAYQLRSLDRIPAYSAINESVNLVKRSRKTSAAGFVNAILRKASGVEIKTDDSTAEKLSVETSHPQWLVEKWIKDLGEELATETCRSNNVIGPTAFRLTNNSGAKAIEFAKASLASSNVSGCYFAVEASGDLLELAESGEIYIQDEASQMAARSLLPLQGKSFLDVCAAPGGKAGLILAENEKDVFPIGGDKYWSRLRSLERLLYLQGVTSVKPLQFDAENTLPFAEGSIDSILIDAPCSGTGTIKKNPELRYRLDRNNIIEHSQKQRRILENASKILARGGVITYLTCSLEKEENEQVCEVLASRPEEFEHLVPNVPKRFITADGFARTYPSRDSMDGFFIASFRRR